MNEALKDQLLAYINSCDQLKAFLYDLDLLPDQLSPNSAYYNLTLRIAWAWKRAHPEIAKKK